MPEDDFIDDEMEREPSTFDPGSEMSANLKLLHTGAMDQAIAVPSGNLTSMGEDQLAASSGNWQILGTTADDA
ncbi:hypothetical protein ABEF95_015041 [Exophiala dermatitidis]